MYEGEQTVPVLVLPEGQYGADTAAALVVHPPAGDTTAVATTSSGEGKTHTANTPVLLTMPGTWTWAWTVTGTGAGKRYEEVRVAPAPVDVPLAGTLVYATTADYARWLQAAPPVGAARSLRVASERVDELLRTAVYQTDAEGLPVDQEQRDALRWATCAQADYQRAIGDPYGRGALGTLTSVSIGSVSIGRGVTASGTTAPPRYSDQAVSYLATAGLLGHGPWVGW